ncbi:MAG: hypothetical protein AVO33_06720 [delta proteobacterium ML8_F1]|nr:MAG: hypothetical protein AVO33_06720 [delta proteobacterium ML8_F1]
MFYEKGYHGTSTLDITTAAKVAPGTFYIYYKDKYSLYKYLLLSYSHDIRKAIAVAATPYTTRAEKERIGLRVYFEYIHQHKHVYSIIWESLYIDKSLFMEYYESFADRYRQGLLNARKAGEVIDADLTVMSYLLMGVSNFVGLKYMMFDDDAEPDYDYIVDETMKILQEGLFSK